MAKQTLHWTDQYVEELIGNLLRVGVTLAAVVFFSEGAFTWFAMDWRHLVTTFLWVNPRTCATCQES